MPTINLPHANVLTPTITGVGLVTAIGRTANETWQSLLAGKFISTHTRVDSLSKRSIPRVASLAIESANEAVDQAGWKGELDDVAVIACTSKGSVENWLSPSQQKLEDGYGLCDLSAIVARNLGFTFGPRLTLSAACAGGLHGVIRAAMMIQNGEATRVLVVAAEASVHPLFLSSFQRLGVFPPAGELCRPFDQNRSGFLMSDAAAAICMEAGPSPHSLVQIDRFAFAGDATHLTRNDTQGTVLRFLLNDIIGTDCVDLVHAHGTGTVSNDATELAAISHSLPAGTQSRVFSHKAAVGHSLGASGLVSVVLNTMCHQSKSVPPNICTYTPLTFDNLQISQSTSFGDVNSSLVHAAGFGGSVAAIKLRS